MTDAEAVPARRGLTPLYHRIYLVLREQLLEGAFPADKQLPGEHELARLYGVSRVTIRQSLRALESDGLISRQIGRGTFPAPRPPAAPKANIGGLLENLLSFALRSRPTILEFTTVEAPRAVAAAMDLPPGAPEIWKLVRVRSDERGPFSHVTTFVPDALIERIDRARIEDTPILTLLEAAGHPVGRVDQTLAASNADPDVAAALDVDMGTALLALVRLVRDPSGLAIEYSRSLYRSDRYEYSMAMATDDNPAAPRWVPVSED